MKKNYYLLAIFMIVLAGCEKDDDIIPADTRAIIDGVIFSPSEISAEKAGGGLILTFAEGTKKIEIVTNDTVAGTYSISSHSLKSASVLQANITYTDGNISYNGTGGTVQIMQNAGGTISGVYNATLVSDNNVVIEISSGTFSNIQTFSTNSLIGTEAAINDSLVSCYAKFNRYIEFLYLFDAVYTNRISPPGILWNEIHTHTQTAANDKVLMLWSKSYDIIYLINLILSSSEDVITDLPTRNVIDAQAKAMRAFVYYNLEKWFGAVPIEQGYSAGTGPGNSLAEILDQVKADATHAIEYLPPDWPVSDNFRIPKSFAQGLLTRVFLNENSYTEALNLTQQIINDGTYSLSQSTSNFAEGNSEVFWGFGKGNNNEFNDFFTKGLFVPVLRLTETYLISSEAYFYSGSNTEAISHINVLKSRGNETEIMSVEASDILEQWHAELELEGSTFITLKRFGMAENELQIQSHHLLLPIPGVVLNSNPDIIQNPGY